MYILHRVPTSSREVGGGRGSYISHTLENSIGGMWRELLHKGISDVYIAISDQKGRDVVVVKLPSQCTNQIGCRCRRLEGHPLGLIAISKVHVIKLNSIATRDATNVETHRGARKSEGAVSGGTLGACLGGSF